MALFTRGAIAMTYHSLFARDLSGDTLPERQRLLPAKVGVSGQKSEECP
ncbi:unnamed protein product [marine sediment metagenome]|uniref:Uncharacterized protein n=1 Tax=marine sediment metagenome TaxID=412755 RepID=X0Y731_9ZZZZ